MRTLRVARRRQGLLRRVLPTAAAGVVGAVLSWWLLAVVVVADVDAGVKTVLAVVILVAFPTAVVLTWTVTGGRR